MAASSTKWGNSAVGKTASGNMYAGHDGNVYKNTGNGWQKYDNGSWNSVNKPQPNWQGAENSQQRTGSESYQQRSSGASSEDRAADAGEAAPTVQGEAVSIGPAVEADPVIWTARLRTGRVVIFRASVSRAFRAAALIASVAVEDLAVIASAVAVDLAVRR